MKICHKDKERLPWEAKTICLLTNFQILKNCKIEYLGIQRADQIFWLKGQIDLKFSGNIPETIRNNFHDYSLSPEFWFFDCQNLKGLLSKFIPWDPLWNDQNWFKFWFEAYCAVLKAICYLSLKFGWVWARLKVNRNSLVVPDEEEGLRIGSKHITKHL